MKKKYNQLRATLAITKASLLATLRNPSSLVFGFIFPLVFITVFGFIGQGGINIKVGVKEESNIDNPIFQAIENEKTITIVQDKSYEELSSDLEKGRIDAIIDIQYSNDPTKYPTFIVDLVTSTASPEGGQILNSMLEGMSNGMLINQMQIKTKPIEIKNEIVAVREYKSIDFILPGQLGFSLLSSGIFATAFVFISLKQTLVIKRFFATPIRQANIVIGEALSRLTFSLIQASIIIAAGYFFFDFTLVHGLFTVISMLALSSVGLLIFLAIGFIVSSIAKDENAVPPLANLFTLPQFLLAGTFFPIDVFPSWLQPISKILPLTFLNDAMRKIAFEGVGFNEIGSELIALFIWGAVLYFIAIRVFKWD